MANHHRYMFACQHAAHREKTTCEEGTVFLQTLHVGNKLNAAHLEKRGIVEQCAVDTTTIGSLDMAKLIPTSG